MKRSGVADMSHRIAGHRYVVRVRRALVGGASVLGAISRRLSFPHDSLALLALLLATNLLRIHVPGPVADGVFGVTVLFLALSLFREPFPAFARTTVLCFAALLTVYAVGLFVAFSIQGASNLAGILFAGVIFLFCWRNAPTLIRARYAIPLLLAAALGLFPLYLLSSEFNPHGVSIILGYSLLTVGLIVIARSDNQQSHHRWAFGLFLLVAAIAVVFGYRSLALVMLLAHPLYWSGYFFLRNRLRTGVLVATAGLLIGAPIVLLGTSLSDAVEAIFGDSVRDFTGDNLLTGREVLWRYSLAAIAESPWLGRGPGAVVTRPGDNNSPLLAQPSGFDPSCLDNSNPGLLEDCAALLEARNALDGDSSALGSWRPSNLLRDWRGVKVGGAPPRVVELNLPSMALTGIVPPVLSELDRLVALRLGGNRLTGAIPPELGRLANLRELALGSNALGGPIPPQLGDLEQLALLHLRRNRLTGPVPRELAGLTNLRILALDFNALSGPVPRELAKLPNLEELRLAGNRVDIPPELAILDQPPALSPDDNSAVPTTARLVGSDLFCPSPGLDGDLPAQAGNLALPVPHKSRWACDAAYHGSHCFLDLCCFREWRIEGQISPWPVPAAPKPKRSGFSSHGSQIVTS